MAADSAAAHAGRRRSLTSAGVDQRAGDAASFVLIMHDLDAAMATGLGSTPLARLEYSGDRTATPRRRAVRGATRGRHPPDQRDRPVPSRPWCAGDGPGDHYVFELFALDTTIDVAPTGASPAETRAAVLAAMAGEVRGKAAMMGFSRGTSRRSRGSLARHRPTQCDEEADDGLFFLCSHPAGEWWGKDCDSRGRRDRRNRSPPQAWRCCRRACRGGVGDFSQVGVLNLPRSRSTRETSKRPSSW